MSVGVGLREYRCTDLCWDPPCYSSPQTWGQALEPLLVKNERRGTPQVVQWLTLQVSCAGGSGLIPGQGTKIPCVAWRSQKRMKGEPDSQRLLSGGEGLWPLEKSISTWFLTSDGQEHTLILLQSPKRDLGNLTENHVKLERRATPKGSAREGTG